MRFRVIGFGVSLFLPVTAGLMAAGSQTVLWDAYGSVFDYEYYEVIDALWLPLTLICTLVPAVCAGLFMALVFRPPQTLAGRLCPLLVPALIYLLISIPAIRAEGALFEQWGPLAILFATVYAVFLITFLVASAVKSRPSGGMRGNILLAALTSLIFTAAACNLYEVVSNTLYDEDWESVGHGVDEYRYFPFHSDAGSGLVHLDYDASLRIDSNHPHVDGAIALLPVYGSVVAATYKNVQWDTASGEDEKVGLWSIFSCTNTPSAWRRLINDEIDIFFGAPPSNEQLEAMREAGLEPVITPILKEAFVFMVHTDNPVENLSIAQIQDIYTKNITNWEDVGGPDERILPFQRPEGSGSQSTMQDTVMQGNPMASPLREERMEGMGDIINAVADYRNRPNSLGYSFRWYATEQFPSDDIRFLAVDGVLPTVENIRNGSYPYTVSFVMVSCRPLSDESKALMDWILGAQGQELIAKTGYVPLN